MNITIKQTTTSKTITTDPLTFQNKPLNSSPLLILKILQGSIEYFAVVDETTSNIARIALITAFTV